MWLPAEADIEKYSLLKDMLKAQANEFDKLSNKKPDGQLNEMKINMVNRILEPLNEMFKNEPAFEFLEILNKDEIPTNSDVVLIISQYFTAIEEFRKRYYIRDEYLIDEWGKSTLRWVTKEKPQEYYRDHDANIEKLVKGM